MKTPLLVFLVTGGVGVLLATGAEKAGPRGPGSGGGPGFQGGFPGARRGALPILDEQQRQLFQEALEPDGDQLRGLEEKLRAAQKAVLAASLDEKCDEKVVRSKAEAAAAIQVEITLLRAKALASVAPTLKPDQKEQIIESPAGLAMLNSSGTGGSPGGATNMRASLAGRERGGMAGLDEVQRRAYQQALQKEGEKLRGLEQKLRAAQKSLLAAALESKYEEKTVGAKAEAVAQIQTEMTLLRARALAAAASTIRAEQKQQIIESPLGIAILNGGGPNVAGGGGPPGDRAGGAPVGPGGGGRGGFGAGPGDAFTAEGREGPARER